MSCDAPHIRALPNRRAASLRGTLHPAPAGTGIGGSPVSENAVLEHSVSGFLVWLKLWFACVAEGVLTDVFPQYKKTNHQSGYQRPPSLLADEARAAIAPQVLCGRRRRRIIARGLPASRRYDGLQYLNDRQLTGNQFLERACRLSVNGRVGIYGLEYRLRLCQRRHEVRRYDGCASLAHYSPEPNSTRVNFGLSPFHLGPD